MIDFSYLSTFPMAYGLFIKSIASRGSDYNILWFDFIQQCSHRPDSFVQLILRNEYVFLVSYYW